MRKTWNWPSMSWRTMGAALVMALATPATAQQVDKARMFEAMKSAFASYHCRSNPDHVLCLFTAGWDVRNDVVAFDRPQWNGEVFKMTFTRQLSLEQFAGAARALAPFIAMYGFNGGSAQLEAMYHRCVQSKQNVEEKIGALVLSVQCVPDFATSTAVRVRQDK